MSHEYDPKCKVCRAQDVLRGGPPKPAAPELPEGWRELPSGALRPGNAEAFRISMGELCDLLGTQRLGVVRTADLGESWAQPTGDPALVYLPRPGEPGTLAEIDLEELRGQLAAQGLHIVTRAEAALVTAALAWLEDGGWESGSLHDGLALAIQNVNSERARR